MTGPTALQFDARVTVALFDAIEQRACGRLVVLGICGAQGSGKSTLARAVMQRCAERGIAAAVLSLDDLYLTHAERQRLAREVHPLLATRGVPGTHDVGLGLEVIAALDRGEPVPLPRFAKAADDRLPAGQWDRAPRDCRLLVFEGWCVGARPQAEVDLRNPVNRLEAEEDRDGAWRQFANDALSGPYQRLFARIGVLTLLAAPGFDVVLDWRLQQEEELRMSAGANMAGVMNPAQIARFIQHYERLTRHILSEMPDRADVLVRLARDRTVLAIRAAAAPR